MPGKQKHSVDDHKRLMGNKKCNYMFEKKNKGKITRVTLQPDIEALDKVLLDGYFYMLKVLKGQSQITKLSFVFHPVY